MIVHGIDGYLEETPGSYGFSVHCDDTDTGRYWVDLPHHCGRWPVVPAPKDTYTESGDSLPAEEAITAMNRFIAEAIAARDALIRHWFEATR